VEDDMSEHTQVKVGQPGENAGRVLYDQDGVRVTGRSLVVDGQRYDIRELRHLRTAWGPRSPLLGNAAIAIGALLVIAALAARYLDIRGWVGAGIVLALPLSGFGLAAAYAPRPSELWCEYQGYTVRILWTKDHSRYGQICRAITRAQEDLLWRRAQDGADAIRTSPPPLV
jgi:hypothetical protein